ncbi:hypothetical protein D3C87_2006810 [compost metagenome]
MSYKTLYNVMNGASNLTFDQVVKASEILNFDIGDEFYKRTGKSGKIKELSDGSNYRKNADMITVGLTISGSLISFEKFPTLLNKIRGEALELGFEIQ